MENPQCTFEIKGNWIDNLTAISNFFRILTAMKNTVSVTRTTKVIFIVVCLSSATLNAQVVGGNLNKLFDLYLLEKFEDCYIKAFKMTESESTKSDPEPYLYVAMCNLKFAEDNEMAIIYPNAMKDAFKYAGKAVKLVEKAQKKEQETISLEDNIEFLNTLARKGCEEAKFQFVEDKFSKAAYFYKQVLSLRTTDPAVKLALGGNHLLNRNIVEGSKIAEEGWKELKAMYGSGDETPAEVTKEALRVGIMAYGRYLNENGNAAKAKEIAQFGKDLLPEDIQLQRFYDGL